MRIFVLEDKPERQEAFKKKFEGDEVVAEVDETEEE